MMLRDRLLDAAVKVYGAHGYRGATTRRIADAAGVNEVTLFRTFGSKAALIDEAVRARSGASGVASLPVEPADPQAELTAWATALHGHLRRMRSLIRKCMSEMEERPKMSGAACEGPTWAARELRDYGERLRYHALVAPAADFAAAGTMLLSALMHDAMGRELMPGIFPVPAASAPAQYVRVYLRAMGVRASTAASSASTRAPRRRAAATNGHARSSSAS
ncbi:MAG: TetR/AcrR family transcriptional regulator [Gemmatimonadetes bacterium]|nr:TetR/AcrR family transcriptional regulator [Gemmatimonadota bacterium]